MSGNLFISFLPPTYTNESLRIIFSPFGEIESCRVMIDLSSKTSRGFGFVKFKSVSSAQYAINSMNGARVENKTLLVRFANSNPGSTQNDNNNNEEGSTSNSNNSNNTSNIDEQKANNNIFIKGLPIEYSQEQLSELFSTYGEVVESKLLFDITTNTSRGQGLVRYNNVQSAIDAVKALDGFALTQDPEKLLIVKFADNEEEKKQKRQKLQQKQMRQTMRFSPYPSQLQPSLIPATNMYPFYQTIPVSTTNIPTMNSLPNAMIQTLPPTPIGVGGGGSITPGVDPTNLYVYNLPSDADDSLLYRLFSPCGAIASVKIVRDPINQACKGYGFVRMVSLQDSYAAINTINGVQVGGKTISVSFKK